MTDTWTMHMDKEIWGEDAEEFRPERFDCDAVEIWLWCSTNFAIHGLQMVNSLLPSSRFPILRWGSSNVYRNAIGNYGRKDYARSLAQKLQSLQIGEYCKNFFSKKRIKWDNFRIRSNLSEIWLCLRLKLWSDWRAFNSDKIFSYLLKLSQREISND